MNKQELMYRIQKMIDQNLEMIEANNRVLGYVETTMARILPVIDEKK
jgi:hypothetical protein